MLTQPNPLLVLSMHRSGASALAGCLHLLGFNLGPSLKPTDENNEQGYWENEDLVLIHEILLRQLGCSWDMIGSQPAGWLDSAAGHKARQNLQALLERSFSPGKPWAVKDPRLCPLMPLWTSVLEERGERPGIIVLVRHPQEVAASLARRDKMDIRKSLLLWLAYNREAFAACRERPHVVITYDQLLANPIGTLANIEKRLSISFPNTLQETRASILSLVRTDLKHEHVADRRETVDDNYSYFSLLYDYIRTIGIDADAAQALSQASQESAAESRAARDGIFFQPFSAELPLPTKGEPLFMSSRERLRKAAPQLFETLLEHIGAHEREWANHRAACERRILTSSSIGSTLFAEVYFPQAEESTYSEKHKETFLLVPEVWQELACVIEHPMALRRWGLRIDPLNTKGMVSISEIQLINASTREPLFRVADPQGFVQLRVEGHGFAISGQEAMTLCAVDSDPQIYLPPLDLPDCPLELRVWLKVQTSQEPLQAIWADQQQALAELSAALKEAQHEAAGRIQVLESGVTLAEQLASEYQAALSQSDQQYEAMLTQLEQDLAEKQEILEQNAANIAALQENLAESRAAAARMRQSLIHHEGFSRQKLLTTYANARSAGVRKRRGLLVSHSTHRINSKEEISIIAKSGLFDAAWYARRYADIIPQGVDPLEHYVTQGACIGLDPCPLFSTYAYLQENWEVVLLGQNALAHYLTGNHANSRDPHPLFSTTWYRQSYPEVVGSKINPLVHYLKHGITQGLQPHPLFEPQWYEAKYRAAAESDLPALVHFVLIGLERGYDPGPLFRTEWYKATHPEVTDFNMPPLLYYLRYGRKEHHSPSPEFDPAWYMETHQDVAKVNIDPLFHYVRYGREEGRQGSPD